MTNRMRMTGKGRADVPAGGAPDPAGKRTRRNKAGAAATQAPPGGRRTAEPSPHTDVWQARIDAGFGAQLLEDGETLGLAGKTEIVRAALQLLHREAAEMRMAQGVLEFYGGEAPLPDGVLPLDESELDDDPEA